MNIPRFLLPFMLIATALPQAGATVALAPLFGNNMVLQRGKPVPVSGIATSSKGISVTFNGQTKTTTSDAFGNWQVILDAMVANASGGNLTATETGANTVTMGNVVVGDVWICSGQSNMAFGLGGCNRQVDIDSANYPVLRQFSAPLVTSDLPLATTSGSWTVCSPSSASGFSAVAFYFGRKICQDQSSAIPIGLCVSSVGGTRIDPWLAPEGAADIPVLAPLYTQSILPWGPFSLFNGMVYPYSPMPAKGLVWYQGENSESTTQSVDSYYLKMKALAQGYKRMLGMDDFAFYFVQLANWGTLPTDATPVLITGGWDADTRIQQANAMAIPHAGMASALDIGDSADMHPLDKLDLGERLALWALKYDYGRTITETSGPILKNVTVSGNTLVCTFDHLGSGLMVGSKTPYLPTAEVVGGTLQKFSIAAASGTWYAATATIVGNTVAVSSPSVTTPTRVAYACWQNPVGCNLYNKDGLPASPFYVDDVTAKYTVTATAATGGSISPADATTYLKRKTALYTITPDAGKFILDVKVDGVSVGSVNSYTFDPLYANHTIAATFATLAPSYAVTTASSASGTISPSGPLSIAQAGSQTFKMVPNSGCRLISTTADGVALGNRSSVTFTDVRTPHAVSATFAIIPTPGTGTGLRGDYYIGTNFDTFKLSRTDATVNFDWGTGSPDAAIPADGFTARWTGQIQPQFTETYKFYLNHDNGAKLWVNNQLLVTNWTGAGIDDTGSISLIAGTKYDIKLELLETSGNAKCKLEWYSPSLPREVVPQSQLFVATTPIYTLNSSAGSNGAFSPSGAILANAGGSQTYSITPAVGYYVADVKVDNVSVGTPTSYTFSNITANHTITATFASLPSYLVSGTVTNKSTSAAIAGATVNFYTSASFIGSASYTATTNASGNYSINIPMGTWCMNATATSYFNSAIQSLTVSNAAAGNINFALADGTRNIPRTTDLLFSVVSDSLPASGSITGWATYQPSGQTLTAIGTPTVESILSQKWEKNLNADGDGFRLGGAQSTAIACTGATIVVAAKPIRNPDSGNWRSLVDIFYDRLVLGISDDLGKVSVRRNGSLDTSSTSIPDGQVTILTLIVQTDGSYSVYANGNATAILSGAATGANSFIALTPGVTGGAGGYGSYINVGRNNPDGWSVTNGYIGDVFVYKTALSAAERQTIESDMLSKYITGGATNYTINASAGSGGSISPVGSTSVNSGASQKFTITANSGYTISGVTVDGVSVGAVSSYTFSAVAANHTISAAFTGGGTTYTITASAGAGGSISPSGAVSVNAGGNQTFTITANSGYTIAGVTVDGASVGAVTSYPFTNVTATHTIAATFAASGQTTYTITATAGTGGSISPSGAVSVNAGGNQTFTITANSGYTIAGVTVDGASVGAMTSYPFTNVTATHTIAATFAAIVNTAPTISTVANQSITANTATAALAFTVSDSETAASALSVTSASSNTTLVPAANVVLGGNATNRTVSITPAANQTGSTTITLTVSDGALTGVSSFTVTVTAAVTGTPRVISINVGGFDATHDVTGSLGAVAATNWNNLTAVANPSGTALKDDSGTATTLGLASSGWSQNTFNAWGDNRANMYSNFIGREGDPISPATITLTGIPYATYDVYLYYTAFWMNNGGEIQTWTESQGSSTLYGLRGPSSGGGLPGYQQYQTSSYATATADVAGGTAGGNYLVFSGLSAANLTLTSSDANQTGWKQAGLAGIQIVKTSPANTFATWIAGYPALGSATGFNDDPDGDGIPNGLENFFGTDPTRAAAGVTHITSTGTALKFRHTRSNTVASNVTAVYQWSSDLVNWFSTGQTNSQGISATIVSTVITDTSAPANDVLEVTVTFTSGASTHMFARIEASQIQ